MVCVYFDEFLWMVGVWFEEVDGLEVLVNICWLLNEVFLIFFFEVSEVGVIMF